MIPHWKGEVGLNVDLTQIAHQIFARTSNIDVGSAVMNILCNGGPIAAAERVAYAAFLHGLNPGEKRKLHVGFAAGRFDFMNRASGIVHRDAVEEAAGPAMKGKTFAEAAEIFLKLLRGDTLSSDDVTAPTLRRSDFRSDEHWESVCEAYGQDNPEVIPLKRRWEFESFGEYMNSLRQIGPYANVAVLAGHSVIRTAVMGEDASSQATPTEEQLSSMRSLVREAMAEGAIGLGASYSLNHSGYGGVSMPSTI